MRRAATAPDGRLERYYENEQHDGGQQQPADVARRERQPAAAGGRVTTRIRLSGG